MKQMWYYWTISHKELVTHVFPCYYGNFIWFLSFEYGLIPSWCSFYWLTKAMRHVARKLWESLNEGEWRFGVTGITGVLRAMSGTEAVMLSRKQAVRASLFNIWTWNWNSWYSECDARNSSKIMFNNLPGDSVSGWGLRSTAVEIRRHQRI